jgi:hypothetical protein
MLTNSNAVAENNMVFENDHFFIIFIKFTGEGKLVFK